MKKFIIIITFLMVFVIGINIGGKNDKTQADIIQDKIDAFENDNLNNYEHSQTINPNILNKVATKCNTTIDSLVEKILKAILQ